MQISECDNGRHHEQHLQKYIVEWNLEDACLFFTMSTP